jgi:hypothetical protein
MDAKVCERFGECGNPRAELPSKYHEAHRGNADAHPVIASRWLARAQNTREETAEQVRRT